MSELKFKAYGELEISEALSDASHVIIEENGDVKRFPANSIGKVKTVNGVEPDDNGNVAVEIPAPVQPDLSQNDPEAPDYVKGVIRQESLPEGYPYKTEIENVILPETEFTTVESDGAYSAELEATVELIAGHAYNVTFDGDEYTCVAFASNTAAGVGNLKFDGGPDTGEPFLLVVNSSMTAVATESANTYTISIKEVVCSYSKIDEKYLSDYVAGPPIEFVVSENGTSVSCDLSNEELLSLSVHDLQKRCVLVDGSMKLIPQSITTGTLTSAHGYHTTITFVNTYCSSVNAIIRDPVYVVIKQSGELEYITATEFKEADIVRTATIGQTIVVKSVDENGKPTEWEAVDMPNGGSTVYYGSFPYIYNDASLQQKVSKSEFLAAVSKSQIYVVNTHDEYSIGTRYALMSWYDDDNCVSIASFNVDGVSVTHNVWHTSEFVDDEG